MVIAYDGELNMGADESDFFFTIADLIPPSVTVVAPNGGEEWAVGSLQDIRWIAADNDTITRVDIRYSSDGGATYPHVITTDTPNDSLYEWTVPATVSDTCLMRITAYDGGFNSNGDLSDGYFSILFPDTLPPQVTVVAPNGGENWYVGSEQFIEWVATDDRGVDSVDVLLSTNGGTSFSHTLATGEPNDSSFTWIVEDWQSNDCIVRIIAYDGGLNSASDLSDSLFSISVLDTFPPAVDVFVPDGGEEWLVGNQHEIQWVASDSAGVDSVDIYMSVDAGATFPHVIATGEVNDSTFTWTVEDWQSDSCVVKIVAHDPSLNAGFALSDSLFTITTLTAVPDDPARGIAVATGLLGCSPNPFNPLTTISFALTGKQHVTLRIFDVQGRMIRELVDMPVGAGVHSVTWDGRTGSGAAATSGVYFVRMKAGEYTGTSKLALLR
jgi:hypothetical protein